jgi:hypothetical protein
MQIATFYGSSDDLVEVAGVSGADEFNVNSDLTPAITFNLGGQMRVHAFYDGCWSFAVGQVDEDLPLPLWPLRIEQSPENNYSTQLTIECPDDVQLFIEEPRRKR